MFPADSAQPQPPTWPSGHDGGASGTPGQVGDANVAAHECKACEGIGSFDLFRSLYRHVRLANQKACEIGKSNLGLLRKGRLRGGQERNLTSQQTGELDRPTRNGRFLERGSQCALRGFPSEIGLTCLVWRHDSKVASDARAHMAGTDVVGQVGAHVHT